MEEEVSKNFKELLLRLESQHLIELRLLRQEALLKGPSSPSCGTVACDVSHAAIEENAPVAREDLPIRRYPVSDLTLSESYDFSDSIQFAKEDSHEEGACPATAVAESTTPVVPADSHFSVRDSISTVPRQVLHLHRFSSSMSFLEKAFFETDTYELCMGALILVSVVVLALEMQFTGYQIGYTMEYPRIEQPPATWDTTLEALRWTDRAFTGFFVLDILLRLCYLRCAFFASRLNILDFVVISCSVLEEAFGDSFPVDAPFLRLLRFAKVARSLRVLKRAHILGSLHLLLKSVHASLEVLFWSLCLLAVIQCIAGMLLSQSLQSFLANDNNDEVVRKEIFRYFGTFTATLLTMFEVLMANWAPPCRVLVDHVSEWYSLGFIVYRCLVGFAVLNVVSAVFLQQTMKVAAADQEVALQQRQMAAEAYTKKLEAFFKRLDKSGDGVLTWKEFSAVLNSPKLQNWLATLELESHDLVNLFNMIDDGDGEISLQEFLYGARHLHGSATSIAVAEVMATSRRTEAKTEALLMMLANMSGVGLQDLKKQARRLKTPNGLIRSPLQSRCQTPAQTPGASRLLQAFRPLY